MPSYEHYLKAIRSEVAEIDVAGLGGAGRRPTARS